MRVTVLGCGSSPGVPEVGCGCAVCRSTNPRNKRLRASIFIETGGRRLLIDTSPDLRAQALTNNINHIDAVLYTHDHADHIHGIDDMRIFNVRKNDSIPIYGDRATLQSLQHKFGYALQGRPETVWYRPSLIPHEIPTNPLSDFEVLGVRVTPVLQQHARSATLGFRFGDFAYSTDVNGFPEESFEKLKGLKVWMVDCLRYTPSYTHSRLEMTLEWVERLKPELALLTHMAHELDYETLANTLPPGVQPAHDGMVIELS